MEDFVIDGIMRNNDSNRNSTDALTDRNISYAYYDLLIEDTLVVLAEKVESMINEIATLSSINDDLKAKNIRLNDALEVHKNDRDKTKINIKSCIDHIQQILHENVKLSRKVDDLTYEISTKESINLQLRQRFEELLSSNKQYKINYHNKGGLNSSNPLLYGVSSNHGSSKLMIDEKDGYNNKLCDDELSVEIELDNLREEAQILRHLRSLDSLRITELQDKLDSVFFRMIRLESEYSDLCLDSPPYDFNEYESNDSIYDLETINTLLSENSYGIISSSEYNNIMVPDNITNIVEFMPIHNHTPIPITHTAEQAAANDTTLATMANYLHFQQQQQQQKRHSRKPAVLSYLIDKLRVAACMKYNKNDDKSPQDMEPAPILTNNPLQGGINSGIYDYDNETLRKELIASKIKLANQDIEVLTLRTTNRVLEEKYCLLKQEHFEIKARLASDESLPTGDDS